MKIVRHNTALSFKGQNFYIGIDSHKKQWTFDIISLNMVLKNRLSIDPSPSALLKYMQRHYPGGNYYAAYEAGFGGFWAARDLNNLGIRCIVVHPSDVPSSQKERLHKNDRVDARRLARSLSKGELVPYNDLVDQYIQTRERITKQLKKMRLMAKEQAPFKTLIPLLLTVPGVGFITAMTLATEIIDMNRFKTLEHLASYVGLIPSVQSSDETEIVSGISIRRNKHLRTILVEAAWTSVRKDPALTMKFNQLSRRMHRNKAIVRVAKILLNRIRYVWKNQKPYVLSVVR